MEWVGEAETYGLEPVIQSVQCGTAVTFGNGEAGHGLAPAPEHAPAPLPHQLPGTPSVDRQLPQVGPQPA